MAGHTAEAEFDPREEAANPAPVPLTGLFLPHEHNLKIPACFHIKTTLSYKIDVRKSNRVLISPTIMNYFLCLFNTKCKILSQNIAFPVSCLAPLLDICSNPPPSSCGTQSCMFNTHLLGQRVLLLDNKTEKNPEAASANYTTRARSWGVPGTAGMPPCLSLPTYKMRRRRGGLGLGPVLRNWP